VIGGYALISVLARAGAFPVAGGLGGLVPALVVCAVLRGVFRYAEQLCNHCRV
jgi:hypothetical protein